VTIGRDILAVEGLIQPEIPPLAPALTEPPSCCQPQWCRDRAGAHGAAQRAPLVRHMFQNVTNSAHAFAKDLWIKVDGYPGTVDAMSAGGASLFARHGAGALGHVAIHVQSPGRETLMEIMIELTENELDVVAGGAGSASFTFTNTASGTTATVEGTLTQSTTASSASQSGSFSSSST
jgi:hypothetical protein